jgi:hypothetical protein
VKNKEWVKKLARKAKKNGVDDSHCWKCGKKIDGCKQGISALDEDVWCNECWPEINDAFFSKKYPQTLEKQIPQRNTWETPVYKMPIKCPFCNEKTLRLSEGYIGYDTGCSERGAHIYCMSCGIQKNFIGTFGDALQVFRIKKREKE